MKSRGARSSNDQCSDLTVKIGHLDSSPSNGHQGDMPYFGWFWNVDSIAVVDEFIPGFRFENMKFEIEILWDYAPVRYEIFLFFNRENFNVYKKSGQKGLTVMQHCVTWCQIGNMSLTHWGRMTHICVSKLTIIGSDNSLSPDRCQAIIWTNAWIWLIGPLGTNFSEISIGIQIFSFRKMHLKMLSAKWRPFCLGLNGLTNDDPLHQCVHYMSRNEFYKYDIVTWIKGF